MFKHSIRLIMKKMKIADWLVLIILSWNMIWQIMLYLDFQGNSEPHLKRYFVVAGKDNLQETLQYVVLMSLVKPQLGEWWPRSKPQLGEWWPTLKCQFNVVSYSCISRQFRTAFKEILCGCCKRHSAANSASGNLDVTGRTSAGRVVTQV